MFRGGARPAIRIVPTARRVNPFSRPRWSSRIRAQVIAHSADGSHMATKIKSGSRKSASSRKKRWRSRAVVRNIEAGSSVDCAYCDERVKFQAKKRGQQVICHVYVRGVWDRAEHEHLGF